MVSFREEIIGCSANEAHRPFGETNKMTMQFSVRMFKVRGQLVHEPKELNHLTLSQSVVRTRVIRGMTFRMATEIARGGLEKQEF
jgi:hypothetical protein